MASSGLPDAERPPDTTQALLAAPGNAGKRPRKSAVVCTGSGVQEEELEVELQRRLAELIQQLAPDPPPDPET